MSNNLDDNQYLANARRNLKKYRDQHDYQRISQKSNSKSSQQLSTDSKLTIDDQLGKEFEEFLVDRTFSPFDIDDDSTISKEFSSKSKKNSSNQENLQQITDQTKIQVETIGLLVAEKSDLTAKLNQSLKQLERKQSEIDELFGRLKASRERIQYLENDFLNSTSNIQKRELSVKQSEKENLKLKLENIRLSQLVEDLKSEIEHLKENSIDKSHLSNIIEENDFESNRLKNSNENLRETIDRIRIENIDLVNEKEKEKETEKENDDQNSLKEENHRLQRRICELEYLVVQLEKETETIGDYIRLYQDQRQQLQKRYEEKDLLIEELNRQNDYLQKNLTKLTENRRETIDLTSNESILIVDDESIYRKAFCGEKHFHQCSTCRGTIKII